MAKQIEISVSKIPVAERYPPNIRLNIPNANTPKDKSSPPPQKALKMLCLRKSFWRFSDK